MVVKTSKAIESPCTKECRLDPAGLACLGCGRTLDEIQNWISMGEAGRARVLAGLQERRAAMLRAADPLAYWSQMGR